MLFLSCIAIASALLSGTYGRSAGPPISTTVMSPVGGVTQYVRVCDQMTPGHPGTSPQNGSGGYYIVSDLTDVLAGGYTAGETYQLELRATVNLFRGFLIQARDGSDYVGSFINLPPHTQTLLCNTTNPSATVTHNNPARMQFNSLNFTWQAPSGDDGTVSILYTVVQDFSTYFVALDAKDNLPPLDLPPHATLPPVVSPVSSAAPPVPSAVPPVPSAVPPVPSAVPPVPSAVPVVPSAIPSPTMPPLAAITLTVPSVTMLPSTATPTAPSTATPTVPSTTMPPPVLQPDPPNAAPEDYRLIYRIPAGCTPSVDCSYFVGINTNTANNSYLDIYLEGESEGWVAVGFTETANMFSADVLGCNRMGQTDMVYVVDTWNIADPQRWNELDENQGGVFAHSSEFVNRRIMCNFSRLIEAENPKQDLNLNGNYYLLFGRGETGGGMGNFPPHQQTSPIISTSQVNPSNLTQELNPTVPPATFMQPDPPNIPPEDYRLTNRIPANCTPTLDCSYFVGINTNRANDSYLDIYLEGKSTGWVAVGFTGSQNMFAADVLGCNRMGQTEVVHVVDTWNSVSPSRQNVLDANQDGVFAYSAEYVNGTISCNFSRFIGVVNSNQDLNLNGKYFLLFGQGPTGGGFGNFPPHLQPNPTISILQVNPLTDGGQVGVGEEIVKVILIRAHGILMIIAWPILAMTAIFFAAWMKPALPNGEWFQVHRAFMIASLFIAAVGFVLIFVAFRDSRGLITLGSDNPFGTAHFGIGITVMALHILNPIIAAFRCKPGRKNRWIFNLFHATLIGLAAEILALVNIGLGLTIFSQGRSRFEDLTILWVYLPYALFLIVLTGMLLLVFSILTCTVNKAESTTVAPSCLKPCLSSPSEKTEEDELIPTDTMEKPAINEPPPEKTEEVELTPIDTMEKPAINESPPEKTEEVELTPIDTMEKPDINEPPSRKPPSRDARLRWIVLGILLAVMLPSTVALIVLVALPN